MHRPDETASLREDLERAQSALKHAIRWCEHFDRMGDSVELAAWVDRRAYWERAVAQSQRALDAEVARVAAQAVRP